MPLTFSQWHPYRLSFMAEMERFELSHGVTRLPHFECGPFNHLGTSPGPHYYATLSPRLQEQTKEPLHKMPRRGWNGDHLYLG